MTTKNTTQDAQFEADLSDAITATIPREHHSLCEVQSFFEVRGQHNRGRVGDCLLVACWQTAKRAVARATGETEGGRP